MKWLSYLKALVKGKQVLEEAVAQGQAVKAIHKRSSWKSSEFWAAVLVSGAAVAAQVAGVVPPPYGPVLATVPAALYALSRGIAKRDDPQGGVKPGVQTTEFWISILSAAGDVLAAVAGVVQPETAATLIAVKAGIYEVARGLAKSGAQPAAAAQPPG